MLKNSVFLLLLTLSVTLAAQPDRWQQRVGYEMEIDFDAKTHRFTGKQRLTYFNNSPDTLHRVFYHLYFNAFQPNSTMDMRSRNLRDSHPNVRSRIGNLKENEQGYHRINSLKMNGKDVNFEVNETILEVSLPEPVLPNSSVVFEMDFNSQVPVQIRRSGRDNAEGVAYSMTQWYPKMCEYDYQGWHANPYVGREFYGVWGDFDVKISMENKFLMAASGVLQNPGNIGHGYEPAGTAVRWASGEKLTWHWRAENVHDFAWAADPDYKHTKLERPDGLTLHFFYQENDKTRENWALLPKVMSRAFDFINQTYGQYPYKSYAFIQGGDGGMEYPMATLITGERSLSSLIGVSVHELMHAWFYGMLGTNESLYSWMDEGFTEYATSEVENFLMKEKLMPGTPADDPHVGNNAGYINFAKSGQEEPLSVHHDHFSTNQAGGLAAYVKGHVALTELQYVMGKPTFDRAMLRYFDVWKFKHPNANDFIRIMEKESGLELDWFKEYFVFTTRTMDYAVKSVEKLNRRQTKITLERIGQTPMPVDVTVTYEGGKKEIFNLPLDLMRGAKPSEFGNVKYAVLPDWRWTHPTYEITLDEKFKSIVSVEIDASQRMADVDRENNAWKNGGEESGGEATDEKD